MSIRHSINYFGTTLRPDGKEAYDVSRDESGRLGREYYATSAAGWHCPVVHMAYADQKTLGWLVQDAGLIAQGVMRHYALEITREIVVARARLAQGLARLKAAR